CRLGCDAVESPRHLFVDCQQYEEWREGAREDVVKKTKLKLETMGIEGDTRDNLSRLDHFIPTDSNIGSILKRRLKSHLASDWHTTSIRLAGRIFGDFQKRMAATNNC
ncbi:hypothetical protein GALMADRAFT_15977, partial [Galerina marginata CBS 339.88]